MKRGFPGGSDVKTPPAVQETRVHFPGREDPLEEGMATHSGVLAREIHRQWSLAATVHGVAESDQATKHWLFGPEKIRKK